MSTVLYVFREQVEEVRAVALEIDAEQARLIMESGSRRNGLAKCGRS
ncbi:hypothetical protein PZ897_06765 [Hoeflea sp. YIM 152468]|nr:hypothetical protein [Hoeflea sp. YIM 152468]MDF1607872.1 hypothetical protein [Hoeflea sp. YIM 152468]